MIPTFRHLQPDARAALLSIIFFWTFYFFVVTLRSFMFYDDSQWALMIRRGGVVIVGAMITWIIFLALRPLEKQSLGIRMAAHFIAAIPASAAYGAVNHAFFYLIEPLDFITEMDPEKLEKMNPLHMILESAVSWYWFFSAWAAFYLALRYAAHVRTAERRAAIWRTEAQSAQLRALRYQVNPHFLFNTLNSLSSLILKGRNDAAEEMVLNLSAFLRTSLSGDPEELVPLAEEVEQQRLYLNVERVRYGERLHLEVDLDDRAASTMVPPMILQPLVENAIKYAVGPSRTPVTIRIIATRQDDRIAIEVSDDGSAPPTPFGNGLGTGHANVRNRIRAYFGEDAAFSADRGENGGFLVRMSWDPNRQFVSE